MTLGRGVVGAKAGAVIGGVVFSIAGSFGLSWLGTGYMDSLYGK